jgi:hypothetical protein
MHLVIRRKRDFRVDWLVAQKLSAGGSRWCEIAG